MRSFLVLCLLVLLATLTGCEQHSSAPKFQLTDVTGAPFGKSLALTDHNGKARTLDDFRGKVVVLFFGFMSCPDVCPTTLAELAQVAKALGPDAEKIAKLAPAAAATQFKTKLTPAEKKPKPGKAKAK